MCVPNSGHSEELDFAQHDEILQNIHPVLYELFELMKQLTIALNRLRRGDSSPFLLQGLVIGRNWIQGGLLSLNGPARNVQTAISPAPSITTQDALLEACRLSGLIFSDMVLFPIPWGTGVKPRLASQLHTTLRLPCLDAIRRETRGIHRDLVIWVLYLGSIAAFLTIHEEWYIQELSEMLDHDLLSSDNGFDRICVLMNRFLWWEYVCNQPGERIWRLLRDRKVRRRMTYGGKLCESSAH